MRFWHPKILRLTRHFPSIPQFPVDASGWNEKLPGGVTTEGCPWIRKVKRYVLTTIMI